MSAPTAARPMSGRVALVTGAGRARGIGAACGLRLAQLGATVVISDLARHREDLSVLGIGLGASMSGLEQVALDIRRQTGSDCEALALDVTSTDECRTVVDAVIARFGRLDVLVNNAGTAAGVSPFETTDEAAWDLAWQVNVQGASRLSRLALPHLSVNGNGAIVNVASTAGLVGIAGFGAYNVTKHAVVGLTRLLAAELGPRGVRVNAVAPGFIHTDMGAAELDQLAEEASASVEATTRDVLQQIPLRRLGTGNDVAEVVGWLASEARYVTGVIIPVDGGSGR